MPIQNARAIGQSQLQGSINTTHCSGCWEWVDMEHELLRFAPPPRLYRLYTLHHCIWPDLSGLLNLHTARDQRLEVAQDWNKASLQ